MADTAWTEDKGQWLGIHHNTNWNRDIRKVRDKDKEKTKDWDTANNPTAKKYKEVSDSIAQLYIDAKARFDADKHVRHEAFDKKEIDEKANKVWRAQADQDRADIRDAIEKMYKTLDGVSKNIEKIANAKADDPNRKKLADECEPAFADLKVQLSHGRAILEKNKNRADLNIAKINPDLDSEYAKEYADIQSRKEKLRIQLEDLRAIFPKLFDDHEADVKADVKEDLLTDKEAVKSLKKAAETKKEFELTAVELSMALYDVEKKAEGIVEAHAKGRKSDKENLIKECDNSLDVTKGRLDEIGKRIANYFNGKADVLAKKFGALAKLSGGEVQRSGADVTGHGAIKTKTRAKNVPPRVIEPIAAKIEVIRLMGQMGDLGEREFLLMQELQKEADKDIADTMDNLNIYAEISDLTKHIEKTLGKKAFTYRLNARQELTDELGTIKGQVGREEIKISVKNFKDLATRVDDAYKMAEFNKENFENIKKLHDQTRTDSLKEYMNALGNAFGGKKDAAGGKKAAAIRELPSSKDYQGKYATEFSDIWSKVDKGDSQTTVLVAKTKTAALKAEIAKAVNDLEDIHLPSVTPDDYTRVMGVALEDIENSDNEIEERKKAKEKFKETYNKLEKFIEQETNNLDPSAREAFKSEKILLGMFKRRADAASNSGEWKEIQRDLDAADEYIRGYAKENQKHKEKGEDKIPSIFNRCERSIGDFRSDLDKFYKQSVASETDALIKIIEKKNASSNTAQAVLNLITDKKSALKSFTDAISGAMDSAHLSDLAKEFENAKKISRDEVKVREKALAVIRRRRLFLEETKLGHDYRINPFDLGVPVAIMINALGNAEVQLLTQIKRH